MPRPLTRALDRLVKAQEREASLRSTYHVAHARWKNSGKLRAMKSSDAAWLRYVDGNFKSQAALAALREAVAKVEK